MNSFSYYVEYFSQSGANAAEVFKFLYYLWFDVEGNKAQYLKSLEEDGISLINVSSMLKGAGADDTKSFKDIYI